MFCRAFRTYSRNTRLIGYGQSILNTMFTCYSVSRFEKDLAPLPDVIVVNGTRAKQNLEKAGFNSESITVTGAIRHQNLGKRKFVKKGHEEIHVLVALSAGVNVSVELTHKVIAGLGDRQGISVSLKCHPTTPFSIIIRNIRSVPGNISFNNEPIERLLTDADVLIYAESTVYLEQFDAIQDIVDDILAPPDPDYLRVYTDTEWKMEEQL